MRKRAVLFAFSAALFGQTVDLDFEKNLAGWSQTSDTFHAETRLPTETAVQVPIGGTYWKGLPYEIGQHSDHWVTSLHPARATLPWARFFLRTLLSTIQCVSSAF
jgi:hypothetical protein